MPIEPSADLAAHEQPRVDGRWDGWDELRVAQLRQEMDQAVIAEDGSRLCEVILCCWDSRECTGMWGCLRISLWMFFWMVLAMRAMNHYYKCVPST